MNRWLGTVEYACEILTYCIDPRQKKMKRFYCYHVFSFAATAILLLMQCAQSHSETENVKDDTYLVRNFTSGRCTTKTKSPFKAFWNAPIYNCSHSFNINLSLDDYGIIANAGDNFTGDKVVLFYDDDFGLYPYFRNGDPQQPVRGGLPQVANLTAHLEKATEDLLTAIPDPDFSGIGILDWEGWRPQWEQNFDTREVYRKQSKKMVQERNPDWTEETVELLAIVEFEQAAKNYMDSTLRLVKELRPHAKWGFYHFPYCYNAGKPGRVCTAGAVASNENITWLFDSTTALYPSIYLKNKETDRRDYVKGVLNEALRVRRESQNRFVDIYSYSRYIYSDSELYFTKEDLNATILQSAEMGSSGVVFWGSHNDTRTAKACTQLRDYLRAFLGPFVKKVIDAATLCSENICSGNGRCVGDILNCSSSWQKLEGKEAIREKLLWERNHDLWQTLLPCSCDCYKGWNGTSCNQPG